MDEFRADPGGDRAVARHRVERRETGAFADGGAEVRIDEEQGAELGDADDEGQQRRQDQREFDERGAALAAAEAEELHWTLTALDVLIAIEWK
jgi:hypothetical protein